MTSTNNTNVAVVEAKHKLFQICWVRAGWKSHPVAKGHWKKFEGGPYSYSDSAK